MKNESKILTGKIMKSEKQINYKQLCENLHQKANEERQDFYRDPKTGEHISTHYYLNKLKRCCKGGCRHCPFGFKKRK